MLYEIFTLGETPYHGIPQNEMLEYLEAGNRLQRPILADDKMFELRTNNRRFSCSHILMQRCWKANPVDRPVFDEIYAEIDEIMEQDFASIGHYYGIVCTEAKDDRF